MATAAATTTTGLLRSSGNGDNRRSRTQNGVIDGTYYVITCIFSFPPFSPKNSRPRLHARPRTKPCSSSPTCSDYVYLFLLSGFGEVSLSSYLPEFRLRSQGTDYICLRPLGCSSGGKNDLFSRLRVHRLLEIRDVHHSHYWTSVVVTFGHLVSF